MRLLKLSVSSPNKRSVEEQKDVCWPLTCTCQLFFFLQYSVRKLTSFCVSVARNSRDVTNLKLSPAPISFNAILNNTILLWNIRINILGYKYLYMIIDFYFHTLPWYFNVCITHQHENYFEPNNASVLVCQSMVGGDACCNVTT